MKISYDKAEDALYITMSQGKYERSRKVSEVVMVDETADGKVLGIEILDASRNIQHFDPSSSKDKKIQVTVK